MPIVLLGNLDADDRVLHRMLILSDVRILKDTLTRGVEIAVALQKMTLEEFLNIGSSIQYSAKSDSVGMGGGFI